MGIFAKMTTLFFLVVMGWIHMSKGFMVHLQTRVRDPAASNLCLRHQRLMSMHLPLDAISGALIQASYILSDGSREVAAVDQLPYVPGEVADFDKIVVGSAACVLAYAWAAYEFGKRIVTQRACKVCGGSGLVNKSRTGTNLGRYIKCYACGGFLPWENWGRFWQSNMDVGNGGVLQRPAPDYEELNKAARASEEGRDQTDVGEE